MIASRNDIVITSPHELHIPMPLEKLEVAYEIELLWAHFELRQADHLGQVSLPIAPIQRRDRHAPKTCGRIILSLLAGKIVERDRPHALAADYDLLRFQIARRRERIDSGESQGQRPGLNRSLYPQHLLF